MSKRNKVQYVKQDEPSFLRAFKEKVGYKEGPTIDTKRENLKDGEGDGEEDRSDNEDEKPQIVVLKAGDLTADEVHDIKHVPGDDRTSSDSIESGKIKFKKPMKRLSDDDSCSNDLKISSSKKKKEELLRAADETSKKHSRKAVKNSSLLSFGDDDEEEETEDD